MYNRKVKYMKKIILAATAAFAMFAVCGMAEARVHSGKHSPYSDQSFAEESDPLANIFGGENWSVSPQPRYKDKRQARKYQEQQEENWGFASASTYLVA